MAEKTNDPLGNLAVLRMNAVAKEHWRIIAVGGVIGVIVGVVTLLITRAIVRRRRRTWWQRTLDYLEDLGVKGERVVDKMKDLYDENIDTEAIANTVGKQVKNAERELKSLDGKVAAVKQRGEAVAQRLR
jgi:hypothetical protein